VISQDWQGRKFSLSLTNFVMALSFQTLVFWLQVWRMCAMKPVQALSVVTCLLVMLVALVQWGLQVFEALSMLTRLLMKLGALGAQE
jgi:uncharacterized membrane protein